MRELDILKKQKQKLRQNSVCLKKGTYILQDNLRTYIHSSCKKKELNFPVGERGIKHAIMRFIGKTFFRVKILNGGSVFSADAVYFSTVPNFDYKDMKFFDFSSNQKKVLTCCANQKRYDLYIKNRFLTESCFPLPMLLFKDDQKLIYAEELIEGVDWRRTEEKAVYGALFAFYRLFYKVDGGGVYSPTQKENDEVPQVLRLSEPVKVNLHHGDLSADNFRFTKDNKLYFFDFDHANIFPLFYDVFFLMFNEAIQGNFEGMKLLKSGEFDCYFEDKEERDLYLKAFMHRFWLVRLNGIVSEEYKNQYLKFYQQLL